MEKPNEKSLPLVSVIVPAFNNEKTIGETVKSLKNMDYPKNRLEIIVVDDASTDKTAEVALALGATVIRREKRGGCAAAKNTGVEHAKNEIVAFIDSNVRATKNWVKELVKPFEDLAVGAVGGFIEVKFQSTNMLEKYESYDSHFRKRKEDTKSVPGSNSAYRREVFEVVGWLDPYLGEDPDFCYRVLSYGYKMVFAERAIVYHAYPNDVWTYFKKQVYYGWQRTLIFLLRPQCRSILVKDEHTPLTTLLQPFIIIATILSLLLIPISYLFGLVSISICALLIMLNIPFLRYVHAREARFVLFALPVSLFRSFAHTIGMAHGVISFVKIRAVGKS